MNNVKQWLECNEISSKLFHLKWCDGGLSIPSIKERYIINKATLYFKLLNNKDEIIRKIIKYKLTVLLNQKNLITYNINNDIQDSIQFLTFTMDNNLNLISNNKDNNSIKNLRNTIFDYLLYLQRNYQIQII